MDFEWNHETTYFFPKKASATNCAFRHQEFSFSYCAQAGVACNLLRVASSLAPLIISSRLSGSTNTPRPYLLTTVFKGPDPEEAKTGFRADTAALSTPLAERNFAL